MHERGRQHRLTGRVAAVVLLWLVIGTVVNVLVAWGTCVYVPSPVIAFQVADVDPMSYWPYRYGEGWGKPDRVTRAKWWNQTLEAADWDPVTDAEGGMLRPRKAAGAVLVGVPFRGLMMASEFDWATAAAGGNPVTHHIWEFKTRWLGAQLPLRPIMPGCVLNSTLYAVIAWGLWIGLAAARRWRRQKQNRCPACGYSREGLAEGATCPECGSAAS